ncbi:nuclear transport factor 2 family protein [Bacillus sp. SCS-151]|uniref:nuclear transport factor 2 family protein n=1 Tax=Nanhaiella sioensis TaxID=3115293 RepID=UPI00397A15DE
MTNQNNTTVNISPVAASNIKVAQFILSANSTEESFEYFADDIVLELPYAPSLNMPDRFEGKDVATTYLRQMLTQLKGLKLHSIRSYAVEGEPDTIISEYEGDAVTPDGNTYTQSYMNKMLFRDGKLILLREFWNPMAVVDATNGKFEGNVND